jgi:dTDP-4-dehydrorhamnose 3,5-epimerase-like enzyme
MIFTETDLQGAFVLDLERREDDRGFFARAFCQQEFSEHGLKPLIAQANVAYNHRKGTLRRLHSRSRRRHKTDREDAEAIARETFADAGLPPAGKQRRPDPRLG